MLGSQAITWMLSFLQTIFLPRYLGPTLVGQFYLAGAIWLLAATLATFGTDIHLTKQVARYPEQTSALLGTALLVRLALFLISSVVVAVYISTLQYSATFLILVGLIGVFNLLMLVGGAFTAVLQGLELMEYISLANVVGKIVGTALTLACLFLGYGVYLVAIVSIIGMLVPVLIQFVALRRRYSLRLQLDRADAYAMLRAGAPYLVVSVTLVAYQQVDTLVMAALVDKQVIGWYSSVANLFGTLMFVPTIFTAVVFPSLTRTFANAPDTYTRLARKSFDLMFLMGIPIGLGLSVIADQIVSLLFGPAFAPAGIILSLLGIVAIFTYFSTLFGYLLIATDRTHRWTIVIVIGVIATVPLDLLLIPWCQQRYGNGAIGGALSYMLTEFAMAVAGIVLLPKRSLDWSNVRTAWLSFGAGLVMFGVCWWLRDFFLLVPIAVGGITYIGLIVLLRVVPKEDIALLGGMLQNVFGLFGVRVTAPVKVGKG